MKIIQATAFSLDSIAPATATKPAPGAGEILVKVSAATLNYRDLAVLSGGYLPNLPMPFVPASDCCGTVEAVGAGVTRFKAGDRVVPCYIQGYRDGALTAEQRANGTLGGPLPGVLQEYRVVPAEDAIAAPAYMTDAEAATLPIAALTAWSALQRGGIKAGDNVLVQGTGGVALFALQFACAAGARVVALTSTAEKEAMLKRMGAAEVIDYAKTPAWSGAVREATGGRGADIVIETVGSTLPESLSAAAFNGFIGVIGFLGGMQVPLNIRQLIGPMVCVQGIVVGSRAGLEAMCRAMTLHQIHPVLDRTFAFSETRAALQHMQRAAHVGKIVIDVAGQA